LNVVSVRPQEVVVLAFTVVGCSLGCTNLESIAAADSTPPQKESRGFLDTPKRSAEISLYCHPTPSGKLPELVACRDAFECDCENDSGCTYTGNDRPVTDAAQCYCPSTYCRLGRVISTKAALRHRQEWTTACPHANKLCVSCYAACSIPVARCMNKRCVGMF